MTNAALTELALAGADSRPIIEAMLVEHLAELGEAPDAAELARYWADEDRYPFLIIQDGAIAGCALIRRRVDDARFEMAVLHVRPEARRQGIGRWAARTLLWKFPGEWNVSTLPKRDDARAFWRSTLSTLPRLADVSERIDGDQSLFRFVLPPGRGAVRPARASDARAIGRIHVHAWQAAYRGLLPDSFLAALSIDQREEYWRDVIIRRRSTLLVADDDTGRDINGWIAIGPASDPDAPIGSGEVLALYVDPVIWANGVGGALWRSGRDYLCKLGYQRAQLWALADNRRARRFYQRAGFLFDGSQRTVVRGPSEVREIRYIVDLTQAPPSDPDNQLHPHGAEPGDYSGT